MVETDTSQPAPRILVAVFFVALVVLGVKAVAASVTNSQGLFSDAAESVANVLSASIALACVRWAAHPPDRGHPYGHGRIEFFAAGLEGLLVVLAGALILREAVPALFAPRQLASLGLGLALSAVAGVINGAIGWFLLAKAKATHSAALRGEGWHLLSDAVTTAGVMVGLVLVELTGFVRVDAIVACGVALAVLVSGFRLLRDTAHRLLDASDPDLIEEIAGILVEARPPGWIDAHRLRARSYGGSVQVDLHVVLPRFWNLERVHAEQVRIEETILEALERGGEVLVHSDPCRDELCGRCCYEPCPIRKAAYGASRAWSERTLAGDAQRHPEALVAAHDA